MSVLGGQISPLAFILPEGRATLLAQAGVTPANTVSPSLSGSLASPGINSNLSPASPTFQSINNAQSYPPGYMGYHAAYRGMPPPFHLPGPYPMGYSYPHPGPPVFPMWDPYSGPSSTSGPLQNHSSIDPFVTPVLPARIEPVATPNVPNLNHVPTPDPRDVIDPGLLSEPASHDQVSNNNFESPIPDQNSGADIEIDDKEDGEKNQDDSGDESESQTSPRSRVSATKPIYGHVEGAFRGAENASANISP
ncbi:hypothetical protein B0H19DRAFT_1270042 [Mycena capillaripes]|nr:hypothetical protein B0H19DRAFT_1270042 [Mycena capillaripes]